MLPNGDALWLCNLCRWEDVAWEPDLTVAFDKHICGHLGNHFTLLNVLDGSWE